MSAREEQDCALFSRIASSYCQKDMLSTDKLARQFGLEQTLGVVDCPRDSTVLELGCKAGFAVEYLTGRFYSCELIKSADHRRLRIGAKFECANIDDWIPPSSTTPYLWSGCYTILRIQC